MFIMCISYQPRVNPWLAHLMTCSDLTDIMTYLGDDQIDSNSLWISCCRAVASRRNWCARCKFAPFGNLPWRGRVQVPGCQIRCQNMSRLFHLGGLEILEPVRSLRASIAKPSSGGIRWQRGGGQQVTAGSECESQRHRPLCADAHLFRAHQAGQRFHRTADSL